MLGCLRDIGDQVMLVIRLIIKYRYGFFFQVILKNNNTHFFRLNFPRYFITHMAISEFVTDSLIIFYIVSSYQM